MRVNIEESKLDCDDIESLIEDLFNLRYPKNEQGSFQHKAIDNLLESLKAFCALYHFKGVGDVFEMINILMDDSNLSDVSILNKNFIYGNVSDLLKPILKDNLIFRSLLPHIIISNDKGVGEGELLFPLIFKHYNFSNKSDGEFYSGGDKSKVEKVEVKKTSRVKGTSPQAASLKVIKTGDTDKGLADKLNKRYFNGAPPGMIRKNLVQKHIESIDDPNVYRKYFEELYPTACPDLREKMIKNVIENYRDPIKVNQILGQFALESYQKLEGWNNIIILEKNDKGYRISNINDVTDLDFLENFEFSPKLSRGRDSQAIADGYVNIQIGKKK